MKALMWRSAAQASAVTCFRFLPLPCFFLFFFTPNPILPLPVVPAEQLVGAPELDPELAFLLDEANIDENAVKTSLSR